LTCSCTANTDCQGTYPWGNICDTSAGVCSCNAAADCASNAHGPSCDSTNGLCTCGTDAQCTKTPYTKCAKLLATSSILVCSKPCTADADCTALGSGFHKCDTATSKCVGCKATADCSTEKFSKLCDTTATSCVECLATSDCTTGSLGNTCNTTKHWCTCAADADCATNPNGKVCDTGYTDQCVCSADTDCPTGRKCTAPNPHDSQVGYCQ
jgi:hypothetical protein